jgi:hypothetical protein
MRKVVLPLLFSLAMATAASAAGPASDDDTAPAVVPAAVTPTPPNVDANVSDNTIVCKWTTVIGSRLSDRLCLTKRRWKQMHQDGQDFMRNIDERSDGGQDRGM